MESQVIMQTAPKTSPEAGVAASWMPSVPAAAAMDREFILRHQIVERYLSGRLPLKGAQDFERFCREHPELLEEIGLPAHINAGLRLLEAGGQATPWEAPRKQWWQQLWVLAGAAALALALGITGIVLAGKLAARDHTVATLQQQLVSQPLEPVTSTRALVLVPSRTAPSRHPVAVIGGHHAELADLKLDLSWSQFNNYRISIDRIDQGRVAVLHNLQRDSNGQVRLALNTSALGPGDYQFTVEGLDWRGAAEPTAWITLSVAH
jgi:hypothetical protein